jgi:hypothetical protein
MCKTGVAHSKAGVRYKACVKWDANDNGLTMEASIESQQPSAVAISLSVKQSLTVGCECIGCECLPGALSTSISGFYQFQSSNIWQYNSMGVKLTDQFHINTWIAGFISGNMIFAFGHAHAGHTFHSSVAFTKGPQNKR